MPHGEPCAHVNYVSFLTEERWPQPRIQRSIDYIDASSFLQERLWLHNIFPDANIGVVEEWIDSGSDCLAESEPILQTVARI